MPLWDDIGCTPFSSVPTNNLPLFPLPPPPPPPPLALVWSRAAMPGRAASGPPARPATASTTHEETMQAAMQTVKEGGMTVK